MGVISQPSRGRALISCVPLNKTNFVEDFESAAPSHDRAALIEAQPEAILAESRETDRARAAPVSEDAAYGRVAVIESRVFLRECILRGMQTRFSQRFATFSSVEDFERSLKDAPARLIVLSCSGSNELEGGGRAALQRLASAAPGVPVVVLASRQDPEFMRIALEGGAKGYIPVSMGFDLAVEAVRFVLAGGTYVPVELLVAAATTLPGAAPAAQPAITARERLVMRAIQQGKPNKVIAYELNMCESTVKVHVRHIMKKLGAKNRTAVAMKSNQLIIELEKSA